MQDDTMPQERMGPIEMGEEAGFLGLPRLAPKPPVHEGARWMRAWDKGWQRGSEARERWIAIRATKL